MIKIIEFSVAETINVKISSSFYLKEVTHFLQNIYKSFNIPLETPSYSLEVIITDKIPTILPTISLGKDCISDSKTVIFNSGHYFSAENSQVLQVGIPLTVKRGRIPLKRPVVGRHITDEIIEPLLQSILLNFNMTFLHASSKNINLLGGEVIMGWRGTGKTNALIKELDNPDIQILSDDLTIIDAEGIIYPYPRPIRLYKYNLPLLKNGKLKSKLIKKSYIVPPWRPVHYLQLSEITNWKVQLKSLYYLNNEKTINIAKDAEYIMLFEQSFFNYYKLILAHTGILTSSKTVSEIVNNALKNKIS